MLNSKFFTVMIILTLLFAAATVALQVLEMNDYELFQTLLQRFGLGAGPLMTPISLTIPAVLMTAVFLLLGIAGCTQIERDGISPIPQNTPASWELNPYGDVFR